jgi:hypothetical protein
MRISMVSHSGLDQYQEGITQARLRLAQSPALRFLQAPEVDPRTLELCLIHFCSLGVAMTEPVEGWIERAGLRCQELGLPELGRALCRHAREEAGHHRLLIEDTRVLVARWNAARTPALDAEQLLSRSATPSILAYRQLHEETIAGHAPYAQIAIEYEIELLSVRFGPLLLQRCQQDGQPGNVEGLSFLKEHVALDAGHTRFNEQQLKKLLEQHPTFLRPLVQAGEAALDAYAGFLTDCLQQAEG